MELRNSHRFTSALTAALQLATGDKEMGTQFEATHARHHHFDQLSRVESYFSICLDTLTHCGRLFVWTRTRLQIRTQNSGAQAERLFPEYVVSWIYSLCIVGGGCGSIMDSSRFGFHCVSTSASVFELCPYCVILPMFRLCMWIPSRLWCNCSRQRTIHRRRIHDKAQTLLYFVSLFVVSNYHPCRQGRRCFCELSGLHFQTAGRRGWSNVSCTNDHRSTSAANCMYGKGFLCRIWCNIEVWTKI